MNQVSMNYGPMWNELVQAKQYAVEDLQAARRSGNEIRIASCEQNLANVKLQMNAYDMGFAAGSETCEQNKLNCWA